MITKPDHKLRIRQELKKAGVTSYGLIKGESKLLPNIIHEDEHIGGVVYGQMSEGSVMLVATDKRIIFLDWKPLFTTSDEFTYDVVSGVKTTTAGPFSAVTLHTRISDYSLRYVNHNCARNFVRYIEKRRIEGGTYDQATGTYIQNTGQAPSFQNIFSDAAVSFLKGHDLAVLSTVDRTGNVSGAVVYYLMDSNGFIYILTKTDTTKARGIMAHGQVSLTIHESGTLQTAQLQGEAEIETDEKTRQAVMTQIIKPRPYRGEMHLPPVTKLKDGEYTVIRIRPTTINYRDYSKN
jgi:general stress protein 26